MLIRNELVDSAKSEKKPLRFIQTSEESLHTDAGQNPTFPPLLQYGEYFLTLV